MSFTSSATLFLERVLYSDGFVHEILTVHGGDCSVRGLKGVISYEAVAF